MKCDICKKEILPNEKGILQLRRGYVEEDGVTFLPEEDEGYYHSGCFDGVEFPPAPEEQSSKEG